MKVYVLVKVTYDYHRFQDNYGVFKTIPEAEKHANEQNDSLRVLCYPDNFEKNMDDREEHHWCVQEFAVLPVVVIESGCNKKDYGYCQHWKDQKYGCRGCDKSFKDRTAL